MDAPSFRAHLNHTHLAVLATTGALTQLLNTCQTSQRLGAMIRDVQRDMRDSMAPILEQTGLIYNDTALDQLNSTFDALEIVFANMAKILDLDQQQLTGVEEVIVSDVPAYLALRKHFDTIQAKYDTILAKFLQLPKNTSASKLREDSFQLFEIRKQYIHSSMEIWTNIQQLKSKISFVLTESSNSFWTPFLKNFNIKDEINGMPNLADIWEVSSIAEKINGLNKANQWRFHSDQSLTQVLNEFKRSSEDSLLGIFTPSNDLSYYEKLEVTEQDLKLTRNLDSLKEKHGWVYIKSKKLDTNKGHVWIKRWMFIRDDTFGFLAISHNGQFVEESDKIGVLLVNVVQTLKEERKYCLEITGSINLVIQLETWHELKSWLLMFRLSQRWANSDPNSKFGKGRYESLLDALKLKPTVKKDNDLVLNSPVDPTLQKMKDLMENKIASINYHMAINPPMETRATMYSILSNMYMSSTSVPSGTKANFWGYVNWGIRNIIISNDNDKEKNAIKSPKLIESIQPQFLIESIEPRSLIDLRYPDFYPESLKLIDLEMRAIFETSIPRDKFALLKFIGSWSPNSNQTLFCNIYVNQDTFYVYTNNCGLISIMPIKLTNFLHCEVLKNEKGDEHYHVLRIFFISGISIKIKIFYDCYLIMDQLNFIIKNTTTSLKDIVVRLIQIQNYYQAKQENSSIEYFKKINLKDNATDQNLITLPMKKVHDEYQNNAHLMEFLPDNGSLIWQKKFPIPAKALFHILFGDNSHLFHCTLPISSSIFKETETRQSLWRCDSNKKLTRVVWNPVFKIPCSKQVIEKMINNKYYCIVQETPHLKLALGISRKIRMTFIIDSIDAKHCKIHIYHSMNSNNTSPFTWFNNMIMKQLMLFRMEALDSKLSKVVGTLRDQHRKIAFAIKNFGQITKYDSDEPTADEMGFFESVSFIPLQMFSIFYYEKVNYQINQIIHRAIKNFYKYFTIVTSFIKLNWVVLGVLFTSLFLNFMLSGMTSYSYWRERNIQRGLNSFVSNPTIMERSIGIEEIDELVSIDGYNLSTTGSEMFYSEFLNQIGEKTMWIKLQRNELLIKLKLLKDLELDSIKQNWDEFVNEEYYKCKNIEEKYPEHYSKLKGYCDDVNVEFSNLL